MVAFTEGDELPGEWWAARDRDGRALGFGRLDTTWGGDAEILLAVDGDEQGAGVGSFLLDRLEHEAAERGINDVSNRIREHAERDLVHDWLVVRGFRGSVDGDLRERVGAGSPTRRPTPTTHRETGGLADDPGARAPGHEEQGGYVDVDEHQY